MYDNHRLNDLLTERNRTASLQSSEIKVIQISELSCWDDFCVGLTEDTEKIRGVLRSQDNLK